VLALCAWLAAPRAALAQPTTADVYSDAKDIITELIERDIAESIAPNLGCYSPGGLLKYFPGTLQALYERNFGALKDVLQRETIAMAGNYVFESFRERRSIPLSEFLPILPFEPNSGESKCADDMRNVGGPAQYQQQLQQARRRMNKGAYLPLDACSGPNPEQNLELACLFAQAVIASASDRPADAEELLITAVSVVTADAVSNHSLPAAAASTPSLPVQELRTMVLEEVHALWSTGSLPSEGPFAVFAADDALKALTLAQKSFKDILAEPSASLRARAGGLRLLFAPVDFPLVEVNDASHTVQDLVATLGDLDGDAPTVPGEGRGVQVARALLSHDAQDPKGTVSVSNVPEGVLIKFQPGASAPTFTGPGLARLQDLAAMAEASQDFQQLLHALGGSAAADPSNEALLRAAIGLVQSLETLVGAVRSVGKTSSGGFDLLSLLDGAAHGKLADQLCPKQVQKNADGSYPVKDLNACDIWNQAIGLMDPRGLLRPIVAAALSKNYREVATSAMSALFSDAVIEQVCCGRGASCQEVAALYGRLAKSVASYVLLPRDDEDASLAARAAFKSATVDVIRSIGKRGGVEHKLTWRGFLVPTGSLRASWSSSYQLEDTRHTGIRYVPTIDWLTIRVPFTTESSAVYVGGSLSLVDGLAPFAELVSRQAAVKYEDKWLLAAAFIQPRLSGVFAVPDLSKHTVLTLGGSMRGSAPFFLDTSASGQERFGYSTVFASPRVKGHGYDTGDVLAHLFEVSAAVQYVP
jgi:hypothetical protein